MMEISFDRYEFPISTFHMIFIAYVHSSLEHFWLYSVHPRCRISHDSLVATLASPSLLVIEECEDAPDVLELCGKVCLVILSVYV